MDPLMEDSNADAPSLNLLGQAAAKLLEYGNNASNNLQDTFTKMTIHGWLRLTVIVGGYLLLRPYVLKHGVKTAVSKMEDDEERERAKAALTPNELRGAKQQLEEHLEDDDGDGTGADWGQKARVRQRIMLKEMLEAEEQRRMEEEEDDRDIAEFLED